MSKPFITWDVQQHCLSHAIEPPHHRVSRPRFPLSPAVESFTTADKPANTVSKCLGLQAACHGTHRFVTPKALGFHLLSQKELTGCLVESHSPWLLEDFQTSHKGVFLLLCALCRCINTLDQGAKLHFKYVKASYAQEIS